ncbi:hypothetical protein [Riemerella anatipestifer]|uniref:hypothetical protein n=1 Tax=Riemerella anatipestifer TaxID=34085 RepID=UPI00129E84D3|nr:hypothetical protein [Riemerella anatipestifer]MBT0552352.1 hypothetical protein [Riemerella anatipestifer]MBT0554626.1 hypothetical protein [Riemerella anatipestifer]MCE3025080.1 hypothetical protein [Riemerella anatipestifer]MCU7543354.1 hypothetical protein [Riemerella anatipestifer]MCU7560725.1 hypothetical protein [Riemerella anatipestifer]
MYNEKQKFTQYWLWIPLLILLLVMLYNGTAGGTKLLPITHIIGLLVYVVTMIFIYSFTLKIKISEKGIEYSFFPLREEKCIEWEQINSVQFVKYNPFKDFGGYGVRYSGKKNIEVYNVGGNYGILINQKLLLGIKNELDFKLFLDNNGNIKDKFELIN